MLPGVRNSIQIAALLVKEQMSGSPLLGRISPMYDYWWYIDMFFFSNSNLKEDQLTFSVYHILCDEICLETKFNEQRRTYTQAKYMQSTKIVLKANK